MRFHPLKITQISRWLYRVEQRTSDSFWVQLHDCPGIPFVDVASIVKCQSSHPPYPREGVGKIDVERIKRSGTPTDFVHKGLLCDWCNENPVMYRAISDMGTHGSQIEYVCKVCAVDVADIDEEVIQ